MFWTLFLAHLGGDYPLQTDSLARAKRHWKGLVVHVAVHLLLLFLLVGTARRLVWPQLLALGAAHLAIDAFKNVSATRWPRRVVAAYVLDQGLHIASLLGVAGWMQREWALTLDRPWMIYASGYLLATYVWLITERVLARANHPAFEQPRSEQWQRMGMRALALTLYLMAGRAFLVAAAVGLAKGIGWLPLPYSRWPHGRRALLIDLLVPLLITALVLSFT